MPAEKVELRIGNLANAVLVTGQPYQDEEAALLDYLATIVAKEYVVDNNPRAQPEELAEEMAACSSASAASSPSAAPGEGVTPPE